MILHYHWVLLLDLLHLLFSKATVLSMTLVKKESILLRFLPGFILLYYNLHEETTSLKTLNNYIYYTSQNNKTANHSFIFNLLIDVRRSKHIVRVYNRKKELLPLIKTQLTLDMSTYAYSQLYLFFLIVFSLTGFRHIGVMVYLNHIGKEQASQRKYPVLPHKKSIILLWGMIKVWLKIIRL